MPKEAQSLQQSDIEYIQNYEALKAALKEGTRNYLAALTKKNNSIFESKIAYFKHGKTGKIRAENLDTIATSENIPPENLLALTIALFESKSSLLKNEVADLLIKGKYEQSVGLGASSEEETLKSDVFSATAINAVLHDALVPTSGGMACSWRLDKNKAIDLLLEKETRKIKNDRESLRKFHRLVGDQKDNFINASAFVEALSFLLFSLFHFFKNEN